MTDTIDSPALPTRRAALTGLAAASALAALPGGASAQSASPPASAAEPPLRTLTAAPAKARLRPAPALDSEIWAFDGATPGPTLRIRQGEALLPPPLRREY